MSLKTIDEITAVLDRVRGWPLEQQAELARLAEYIEAQNEPTEPVDAEARAAIAEGLAQARRGEFATDAEAEAAFARLRS